MLWLCPRSAGGERRGGRRVAASVQRQEAVAATAAITGPRGEQGTHRPAAARRGQDPVV